MNRNTFIAVIYLSIALVIGYIISTQISAFLGISINPKSLPQVQVPVARAAAASLPEVTPYEAIILPEGSLADERYQRASGELAGAIEYRTGQRPQIVEGQVMETKGRAIQVQQPDPASLEAESYTMRSLRQDGSLTLLAGDALGSVYAVYALATQLKSGAVNPTGGEVDIAVSPEMAYRFVGMGGVGITVDEELWRAHDYSHHSRSLVYLPLPWLVADLSR